MMPLQLLSPGKDLAVPFKGILSATFQAICLKLYSERIGRGLDTECAILETLNFLRRERPFNEHWSALTEHDAVEAARILARLCDATLFPKLLAEVETSKSVRHLDKESTETFVAWANAQRTKQLGEREAARGLVGTIYADVVEAWSEIYKGLRQTLGKGFAVDDEAAAAFDLGLAVLAMETDSLKNLFPREQASRLARWSLQYAAGPEWLEYAEAELREYRKAFRERETIESFDNPMGALPARLLRRWLGQRVEKFEAEFDGVRTGHISVFARNCVTALLLPLVGRWKRIRDAYAIVRREEQDI